jgi:hypothetical protein
MGLFAAECKKKGFGRRDNGINVSYSSLFLLDEGGCGWWEYVLSVKEL